MQLAAYIPAWVTIVLSAGFSGALMLAAIFLGLSYAYRGGLFIRVTLLVDRLSGNARLGADLFANLVTLVFCLAIVFATGQQAVRGWSDDTQLSTLPILVGPAYSFVPLGFLALTVILLVDLARLRQGRPLLASEEVPSAS